MGEPIRINVVTLFPEMFTSVLGSSILKRAADPTLPRVAASNPDNANTGDEAPQIRRPARRRRAG
jgi:tRNA G37 N-methylase TrmD